MIEIYQTMKDGIRKVDQISEGCWIALTNPSATELLEISERCHIEVDHLRAPLDEEERSRIEVEDDYTLILVDIPTFEERHNKDRYVTIPLAIITAKDVIITICLEETPVLKSFMDGRVRDFYTYKKTRFILQILYKNASVYLQYLRIIDRKSEDIEKKLHISTKNSELLELLELEKSLVYFTTSLRANEVVLEKLLRNKNIKQYQEDTELLEDVIIENKQAIEMANIYSGILTSTTEAFASIISNNLNIVMKFLATVTIVLSIPTMISSFFGMNVGGIPAGSNPHGFLIVAIVSAAITAFVAYVLAKKDLF
ncbi:magnesium transporter CorA family protein [Anaeromicropila herbilytica]|uniref:Magnesium transporter n=1 Tax=Anaeromicropila herbilytica TaxID=2785025 RepID=A0A7R7ICY7_9FIRM|nr:magnesium transporter CorA family protein [Anaeromicropila herbilytica]BCN30454.1 magnesium transporter [Anaeromicropila herbilytica]